MRAILLTNSESIKLYEQKLKELPWYAVFKKNGLRRVLIALHETRLRGVK